MKRTKPPFRADHVGSLLRPAALKDARGSSAPRARSRRRQLKAIEDREIERVIKKQEDGRAASRSPTASSAAPGGISISSGASTASRRYVMEQRHRVRRACRRAPKACASPASSALRAGHPMIEHFKFVQAHTKAHAEDDDPGAVGAAMAATARDAGRREASIPTRCDSSPISARPTARRCARFADAGCRYLQLDEVVHRHAVRSEVSRADARRAATIRTSSPSSTPT